MKIVASAVAILLSGAVLAPTGQAQGFPTKPVRIVVPYTAAGPVDFVARTLQPRLQELWGQTVLIDNRPGASAMLGSEQVSKAPPDGYTLLLGSVQTHAMNVATIRKMLYDPDRDFTPITQTSRANWMIAATPALGARTPREWVDAIKAQPGRLSYGSSGVGGLSHLAFEMLAAELGMRAIHVPYKGTGPAVTDVLSGTLHMVMGDQSTILPHVRAGKIVPIAMTGNVRSPLLPDVPTIAETLMPGFDAQAWQGIWGPPGMAPDLARKIGADIVAAVQSPGVADRLRAAGSEPVGTTPDAFAGFVRREIERWTGAGRKAGIQPE